MTIRQTLSHAALSVRLRDAELLLAHVLHKDRVWLVAHSDAVVDLEDAQRFSAFVLRRASAEPLQYILGVQEFYGLEFQVGPGVLIPRPETEHLVEAVIQWARLQTDQVRIVDMGTGSGAIALALATHLPHAKIFATDISDLALSYAAANAVRLGLASRVHFSLSDLLAKHNNGTLDVVVSNPPYIPVGDAKAMQREVVEHEPWSALFAGEDGIDLYRRLVPAAALALRPGGLLAFEIGFGQRPAIQNLLHLWKEVRFVADYAGIDRVALAQRA